MSALQELKEQITAGQRAAALAAVDDLLASFDSDRRTAARDDALATVVRYNAAPESEPAAVADRYTETATELEQTRIELHEALLGYLGEETTASTVVDKIEETISSYETLQTEREALTEHADSVSLGPVLHMYGVEDARVPYGGSTGVGTELENVGDSSVTDVDLQTSGDQIVTTSVSPDTVETVAPESKEAIGLSLTGAATGQGRLRLSADGAEARESTEIGVEVLDKIDYLRRVDSIANRVLTDAEKRIEERSPDRADEFKNRIETARTWLDRTIERAENGEIGEAQVDNRIETATYWLVALLKVASDREMDAISDAALAEYTALIKEALDLLEESKEAKM
ncbi:hypothetical protein [Halomicrobium urmianum]|uniref:hypothetical protein n=1 Tax=Halomicrobium urmianum TaxID=1586233 RepID=UPI001CD9FA7F|nr:hypothetical protein [Halomicrobium urmianum]